MQHRDTLAAVLLVTGCPLPWRLNALTAAVSTEVRKLHDSIIRSAHSRCFRPLEHDSSSLSCRLREVVRLMCEYRMFTLRDTTSPQPWDYLLDNTLKRMQKVNIQSLFPDSIRDCRNFRVWMAQTQFHYGVQMTDDIACLLVRYGGRYRWSDAWLLSYAPTITASLVIYLCIHASCPNIAASYIIIREWLRFRSNIQDTRLVYRVMAEARPGPGIIMMLLRYDHLNDRCNAGHDALRIYYRLRMYLECLEDCNPKYIARLDRVVFGKGRSVLSEIYVRAKLNLGTDTKYWWNLSLRYDAAWGLGKVSRTGLPI